MPESNSCRIGPTIAARPSSMSLRSAKDGAASAAPPRCRASDPVALGAAGGLEQRVESAGGQGVESPFETPPAQLGDEALPWHMAERQLKRPPVERQNELDVFRDRRTGAHQVSVAVRVVDAA